MNTKPRDPSADASEADRRDKVASLAKGLAVIEVFDSNRPRLTLSDVARLTGMTRAAARRYLHTLTQLQYAAFDGRFFSLTPRVLRLGYSYLASSSLPQQLQPFLETVSSATGESCSAAVLDDDEIMYVARSATRRIMSIGLSVGSRLPAHCTSMGRAILAHQPPAVIDAFLQRVKLDQRTPKTIIKKSDLRAELDQVRMQGFALVNEELELGLRSIAVPVMRKDGTVAIAINVGAQANRVSGQDMQERFLPPLREASAALSQLI